MTKCVFVIFNSFARLFINSAKDSVEPPIAMAAEFAASFPETSSIPAASDFKLSLLPGMSPMDFHAVAEAQIDGVWYALDATRLADRRALVRIATGRDAADCSFLSNYGGWASLHWLRVDAQVTGGDVEALGHAASDDHTALVTIS